jgi:hypothetical protein
MDPNEHRCARPPEGSREGASDVFDLNELANLLDDAARWGVAVSQLSHRHLDATPIWVIPVAKGGDKIKEEPLK